MDEQTTQLEETPAPKKKNFVQRHKVAITVIVTSACWITINRLAFKSHNDFLKEHDLYDEYYTPEETEEI